MTPFLNLDLEKPVKLRFLLKHIIFSITWVLGIAIFTFRVDLMFKELLKEDSIWLAQLIPFLFIGLVLIVIFTSKWYYSIVLFFYPLLLLFWFIPKQILANGKIYLLSNYVGNVIRFIKSLKFSILKLFIFFLTLFVLIIFDSEIIRIISIVVFSFFYFHYVIKYLKKSFRTPRLFGSDISDILAGILNSPEKRYVLIKSVEEQKDLENIEAEEAISKKLSNLLFLNYLILNLRESLIEFNGKKAYIIAWIYQLFLFFFISLTYYTFVNFELYLIKPDHFTIIGNPTLFDFFYYTFKTITFSTVEIIIPQSVIARIIEMCSFFTLGILFLVFSLSILFTFKQDKMNESIKLAKDFFVNQDAVISAHLKEKYSTDLQTVISESESIRDNLENLKKIIKVLF
jgi:hypothetical protein